MNKKNKILLIIAVVAVLLCTVLVLFKTHIISFDNRHLLNYNDFAVQDTATITKIFMATPQQEQVLLTREEGGIWKVNQNYPASTTNIDLLLSTIKNITILQIVPEKGWNNINKMMTAGAVKVEIYQTAPKFTLFGIKFGVKERQVKVYYMGPPTQDNQSNFAMMQDIDEPYIVYIPGFRGFISPRYSAIEGDWRDHTVFKTKITKIQEITFKDEENSENSFKIVKNGIRMFDIYDSKNQKLLTYDTTKIIDMLSEFRQKSYERCLENVSQVKKDSIMEGLFRTITIKNIEGHITILKCYRLLDSSTSFQEANSTEIFSINNEFNREISRDKFYAMVSGNTKDILICQYFVFDRLMQPLSYFIRNESSTQ